MNKKKYKSKKGSVEAVSEPIVSYEKSPENKLVFFNSYEEMNERDVEEMGNLTQMKDLHILLT